MNREPIPHVPFLVYNHIENSQHMVSVVDWFILEGASHDETRFGQELLDRVELRGIDYFFGDSTCNVDHHLVEVAALASLGAPYDTATLWSMIAPLAETLDGHNLVLDLWGDEEQAVWVAARLSDLDLAPGRIDERLAELVTLAEHVRDVIAA